jgi:hypothetical protein
MMDRMSSYQQKKDVKKDVKKDIKKDVKKDVRRDAEKCPDIKKAFPKRRFIRQHWVCIERGEVDIYKLRVKTK